MKRDHEALLACYQRYGITVSDMTPSLFGLYLEKLLDSGVPAGVKLFLVGGERLSRGLLESFYSVAGHADVRIVNAYGPTECCVDATLMPFTSVNWREFDTPPIGRPIRNVILEVRDSAGCVVQDGIPGELCIGGRGVAQGYLNDSAATGKRFVETSGVRWYRTGDFGRRMRDVPVRGTRR